MHWLDLGFVATFAGAWPAYENFVRLPRVRAEIAAQGGPRRVREYRITMAQQWTLVALAFVLMAVSGRSWDSVGLVWPSGAGLWWSSGALALIGVFLFVQHRAATGSEAARAAVARQLVPLRWILPASPPELANFRALSVTAGVCEEILFRGYLMAFLSPLVGLGGAVAASSGLFGLAHAYQGVGGPIKAGVLGLIMAGMYLLTGSLLAPILVHALIDIGSGQIAAEIPESA
jgi:membrane protease YdiL (CAAX protease family)